MDLVTEEKESVQGIAVIATDGVEVGVDEAEDVGEVLQIVEVQVAVVNSELASTN